MAIRYFSDENRIFTCADYDHNLREVIRRENHSGTQLASTISDFCTAVSKCSIITNHETRISTLDTNYDTIRNDLYASGGYVDTRINNIINNYAGVTAEYVIDSHSSTDLTKKADVSSVRWEDITNNSANRTIIATLGWVKREVSIMEPEGVAWLDPSSRNYSKNTFGGIHDFTATGTSLLCKTVGLESPSWEVASTMFVNQSLAKINDLPIVTIGQPGGQSWNMITWTSGSISIAGEDKVIGANLNPPFTVSNTTGTYYLHYDPNATKLLSISPTPITEGLVAKITLRDDNTGIVWQPSLDLTKLARLISPNSFTGSNIFTKDVTFGTANNTATRAKALYTIADNLNDNTLVTAVWTNKRIDEAKDVYWSLVKNTQTTADQLRAKEGVIVDLRSGTDRIQEAWATTPTDESPPQAITTKQYVLDKFQEVRDVYWSLVDSPLTTAHQLRAKEGVIVDLRSGTDRIQEAWATTPTDESPPQAITTKEYVLDKFQEVRDVYWSLINEAIDRLVPKEGIIVDLRDRSALATTPTEVSPPQAITTKQYVMDMFQEARDAYWSLVKNTQTTADQLRAKEGVIVDLRSGTDRIQEAWATTPTDESPPQAITTKQYVMDMFQEARDAYWSLVDSPLTTADQLRAKEGVIVDLRSGTDRIQEAWATTPTDESPPQAIATKQYVMDMFQATMGSPIVTLVNIDPPQIEWESGIIKLPTALAKQLKKEECIVAASESPMTLSTSAKYVYVDYTSCAVVYSCDEVNETIQGKVIAVVTALSNGDITIVPISGEGWASIESPLFRGDPRVPTPNANDCDTTIPNTQWVCDKIFNLIHGSCGNAFPRVYQINTADGLQLAVGVTSGALSHPNPNRGSITIAPTVDPIGCVASTREFCWIRYKDDSPYYDIVISASSPSTVEGILIATLTKNGNVINIDHADSVTTETTFSANYRAAWGGQIVYIGPVQC